MAQGTGSLIQSMSGGSRSTRRKPSVADDLRTAHGTAEEQLARAHVMPLLRGAVLRRHVEVAHAPLQCRALIARAAACQPEASVGDANAGGGEPYRHLRGLREERLVLQRSGERVPPMACRLDVMKRSCRPQF